MTIFDVIGLTACATLVFLGLTGYAALVIGFWR